MVKGAILVLEELHHAQARGASIYAKFLAMGSPMMPLHDAHPQGAAARAMRLALRGRMAPIPLNTSMHGGHPLNDKIETNAIKQVFGKHLRRPVVQQTLYGHPFGASGALVAICCRPAARILTAND
jgi:3-oxoacyl-[acyl-carrier-protein] synthase II